MLITPPSLTLFIADMVRMGDVNEATILHNLRMRFAEDLIYTNIGSILVSLNPFKCVRNCGGLTGATRRLYIYIYYYIYVQSREGGVAE